MQRLQFPNPTTSENFPLDFPRIEFKTIDELMNSISWAPPVQDMMSLEVVTSNTWRALRTAVLLNLQPSTDETLRKMEFALIVLRDFMFAHPFFRSIHPQWSFSSDAPELIADDEVAEVADGPSSPGDLQE